MNAAHRALAGLGILLVTAAFAGALPEEAGAQEARAASVKPAAAAAGIENPAASRPIRERMAAYVIVGWVWLSIAVLVWILSLRIKEADRVSRMGPAPSAERTLPEEH